jgi:hypothetical protein
MLRIISCHGKQSPREVAPKDFIYILSIHKEEQKYRKLTATEVMANAHGEITSLTCFGENEALTALANKMYTILSAGCGNSRDAIILIQHLIQGSIDLSRQPREPAYFDSKEVAACIDSSSQSTIRAAA